MDPCEIAERNLDSTGENSAPWRTRSTMCSHEHRCQRAEDGDFHAVRACHRRGWNPAEVDQGGWRRRCPGIASRILGTALVTLGAIGYFWCATLFVKAQGTPAPAFPTQK